MGVKNASSELKHPNRVTQAEHKFQVKKNLMDKRDENIVASEKEDDIVKQIDILDGLELDTLMFDKSGKSADENLVDNYKELKTYFVYLDKYGKDIDKRRNSTYTEDEINEFVSMILIGVLYVSETIR